MLRPIARMPAAMLVWPPMRSAPIARLRSVAMTRGALPTRIWERSSPKVTSRTQWMRFSMPQCPRTSSASSFGPARSGARLVMKYDVSIDDDSSARFARSRTTLTAWRAWGNSPSGTGATETYLRSIRPCPRSVVSCSGGKRPSGEGHESVGELGLVRLHPEQVVTTSLVHDEVRMVSLRVHRVRGHHLAGERPPAFEQRPHRLDLVGLSVNLGLGDDGAVRMEHAGEEERALVVWLPDATQCLAVDGDADEGGVSRGRLVV